MSETYYVTTPIYYVNDVPHIGHSYTTIAADVLARYHRAAGRDVRFLTGTDEHGIKIVKASSERSMTPRQLADQVVVGFKDLWKDLEITHDDFIRTTDPRHETRVQEIIRQLAQRDEIYLGAYQGWYDEGQEEFVTESAARENDYVSTLSGRPLVKYSEPSWFFRLAKWVPVLIEHIQANPDFIQPTARRNEVLSKLRLGVEDLSISRQKRSLDWGVEMPNDPDHVVYVWVDALSNYITALGVPPVGDVYDDRHAKYWPCTVHLIGKDILWFHAVYWPCILLALGRDLPRTVFAHGWWTSEGRKMSKSLGNFISREVIAELCDEYGVDVFRYHLLRAVAFGQDGDFVRDQFHQRYNNELANGVGNLLSRTVNMIERYFDGRLPQPAEANAQQDEVLAAARSLRESADDGMAHCQFHAYIDRIMDLADATNRYIDTTQPFKLVKEEGALDRVGAILYTCAEAVRLVLLYLEPIMPRASARGLAQLGWARPEGTLYDLGAWGLLAPGAAVKKGEALFPRKD